MQSTYLSKGLALLLVCAGRICWYSLWGLYLKMQHMHIQNHTNTFQQKKYGIKNHGTSIQQTWPDRPFMTCYSVVPDIYG